MQCLRDKLKAYHIAGSKLAPALGVSLLEQCAVVTYGKDLQSSQHMNQAQSDPKAEGRQPVKTRHTHSVGKAFYINSVRLLRTDMAKQRISDSIPHSLPEIGRCLAFRTFASKLQQEPEDRF